jgi:hypothetical protein
MSETTPAKRSIVLAATGVASRNAAIPAPP